MRLTRIQISMQLCLWVIFGYKLFPRKIFSNEFQYQDMKP